MMQTRSSFALAGALILFCVWTLATWLLEGRNEILFRGDALERVIYALAANLLLGLGGTALLLRHIDRARPPGKRASAPRSARPLAARDCGRDHRRVANLLDSGSTYDQPGDILERISQVLVVSTAEVLVCGAAVGSAVEALLYSHGRLPAILGAALVTSILFVDRLRS
jgi:hypothetical protein